MFKPTFYRLVGALVGGGAVAAIAATAQAAGRYTISDGRF